MNTLSIIINLLNTAWTHERTDSHSKLNGAMQSYLSALIALEIPFEINDVEYIHTHYRSGFWLGQSYNGKHYGESYYSEAAKINNISFCKSYEKYKRMKPFLFKGKRVYTHFDFIINGINYEITGFNEDCSKITAVSYKKNWVDGTIYKSDKKLHSWNNKEWNEFRKNII